MGVLKTASRGLLEMRIRVPGRAAPPREENTPSSADPDEGVNAIDLATGIIADLRSWADGIADRGIQVAVTSINGGGEAPFGIPERCTIGVSVWFPEGTPADLAASLVDYVGTRYAQHPWLAEHPPEVTTIGLRASAARIEPTHPLVGLARASIRSVIGREPDAYAGHAASDIRFPIRCAGMPAVGFGGLGGGFYGPNEWVDLESMDAATAALVSIVVQLMDQSSAAQD